MGKHIALLSIVCLFFAVPSLAQGKTSPQSQGKAPSIVLAKIKGSVKGMIVDTAGKQNLSDATVSVTPDSDSSDAAFAITDRHGAFLIRNLNPGDYRLLITFEGMQHITRKFSVSTTNKDIDFGALYMQKISDMLQEVVVQRPPMSIKKDTVEYNAEMFATKPNAVVEDQLRKLPGVQVDASGNIIAQGEKVVRVTVNGKRFFSDDPKLASKNFPPEMVEKYQIFDDLDDQSKFTGFDDGNRVKTLNIVTKRDRRQGYFGRAVAGAGTNQNYDESFNFHRFNNEQQISALGQANDINKQNFTSQDILGSSGSRRGGGGGPGVAANQSAPGVTTVWAGGVNYRDAWGPKAEVSGSYFYNFDHVVLNRNSLITKYFSENDDTSNTTLRNSQSYARSQNQRIYFNLEQKLDSSNSFVFRPNLTFQTSRPNAISFASTTDQNGAPISNSNGKTSSTQSGFNINGSNFTFRHKFKKPFRTFSVDLNGTVNNNSGEGYNYSVNNFYRLDSTQILNQHYTDTLHSATFSPTVSYTEPVGKNQILEFNYNYAYNRSTTINNTYDFNDSLKGFLSFDSLFSNSYKFVSTSNRFTLNYRIQNAKFNFNIGSGVQLTDFNSLNTTKNIDVSHEYVHLTPNANFSYSFSRNQRLRFFYSGRTGTPSPSQLQPLTTTNDNINYVTGNPDLKPQFTHSVRILYSSFNPGTQNVVFATINASTIVNDIQSSLVPNAKGGQTTTYVNLNGTYSVGGYFNYGFALKKPKSNLNLISNINYAQSQTLVDTSRSSPVLFHDYTRNTTLAETISWTTNIKKNFDMNFSSASTYNIARNSLHSSQNLDYFTEVLDGEFTAYTNNGWLIASTFTYTYSNTHTPGFNASVPLLSPSIAKELFKKKNGELKLSVFDLLNQNTSVSKTVSLNQVSDSRTTTLSRYVMLTFTYNLNNFAGPKSKRMPGVFPGRARSGGGGGGGGGGGRRGGRGG